MSTEAQLAFILRAALSAAACLAAWSFMIVPTIIENHRQNLFGIRRELFLMVANGEIDASNAAYRRLSFVLGGMIHHIEKVSLWAIVFQMGANRSADVTTDKSALTTSLEALDESIRARMISIRERGALEVLLCAFKLSPFGILIPIFGALRMFTGAKSKLQAASTIAESVAMDVQLTEVTA